MQTAARQKHESVLRHSTDPRELVASAHALCERAGGQEENASAALSDLSLEYRSKYSRPLAANPGQLSEEHAHMFSRKVEACFEQDEAGVFERLSGPVSQDADVNANWMRTISPGIMQIGDRTIFVYGGITEEKMLVLAARLRMLDQDYTQELYNFFESSYKEDEDKRERRKLNEMNLEAAKPEDEPEMTKSLLDIFRVIPTDPRLRGPLHLHITSSGGAVFPTMGVMDVMDAMALPIVTHCVGKCFSAGAVLLMGGDRRVMGPHSFVLFHEARFGAMGQSSQIEQRARNVNMAEDEMIRIVARRTNMVAKWGDPVEIFGMAGDGDDNVIAAIEALHGQVAVGTTFAEALEPVADNKLHTKFLSLWATALHNKSLEERDIALARYNFQVTLRMQLLSRIVELEEEKDNRSSMVREWQKKMKALTASIKAPTDESEIQKLDDKLKDVLAQQLLREKAEVAALQEMIAEKTNEIEQITKRQEESRKELTNDEKETVEEFIKQVRAYEKQNIQVAAENAEVTDLDEMLAASDMEPLGSTLDELDELCSEDIAILLTVIKMGKAKQAGDSLSLLFVAYRQAFERTKQASKQIDEAEKTDSTWWGTLETATRKQVIENVFEELEKLPAGKPISSEHQPAEGQTAKEKRTLSFDAVDRLVRWYEAWEHAGYQMVDDITALREQLNNEYMASILSGRKHEWFADPADRSYRRLTKARDAPRSVIQKNMHILFQNDIFLPAVQCFDLGILTEVKDHSKMYSSRKGRGELHDTSESKSLLIRRANMLKRFRTKQNDFTKRG